MRLHFTLTSNTECVPYNYKQRLVETVHAWTEKTTEQNDSLLYSLSWLQGGECQKEGISFPHGSRWFISFHDENLMEKVIKNAMYSPTIGWGMSVIKVRIEEAPRFSSFEQFYVANPVLARKNTALGVQHLTYNDPDAGEVLTCTLQRKMKKAGISPDVAVEFDKGYGKARTKMVIVQGKHLPASLCPVIVKGSPEALAFAWNVGIGNNTGDGFGSLC